MNRLQRALDRLWFTPMTPISLSLCRWATGGFCLYRLIDLRDYFVRAAAGAPEVFHPVGIASILSEPLSKSTYDSLLGFTIFLAGMFMVGLAHRILAPIFAVCLLFALSYSNSWAMVYHTENMLVLHVLILAITPSASVLSLDASYTREDPRYARFGMARAEDGAHLKFRWPVRLLQLGATLPYVVAGIAKVRGKAGWDWAYGQNLRDQVTMNGLYYEMLRGGAEPITFHVYGWDTAFMFAAMMTLVLELGAPLALLQRYLGYAYVLGIMAMHWSILFIMGIPFPYQLTGLAFVCFFEWDRVVDFAQSKVEQFRGRFAKQSAA